MKTIHEMEKLQAFMSYSKPGKKHPGVPEQHGKINRLPLRSKPRNILDIGSHIIACIMQFTE